MNDPGFIESFGWYGMACGIILLVLATCVQLVLSGVI